MGSAQVVAAKEDTPVRETDPICGPVQLVAECGRGETGVATLVVDLVAGCLDEDRCVISGRLQHRGLDHERMGRAHRGHRARPGCGAGRQISGNEGAESRRAPLLPARPQRLELSERRTALHGAFGGDRQRTAGVRVVEALVHAAALQPAGHKRRTETVAGTRRVQAFHDVTPSVPAAGCVVVGCPLGPVFHNDAGHPEAQDLADRRLGGDGLGQQCQLLTAGKEGVALTQQPAQSRAHPRVTSYLFTDVRVEGYRGAISLYELDRLGRHVADVGGEQRRSGDMEVAAFPEELTRRRLSAAPGRRRCSLCCTQSRGLRCRGNGQTHCLLRSSG